MADNELKVSEAPPTTSFGDEYAVAIDRLDSVDRLLAAYNAPTPETLAELASPERGVPLLPTWMQRKVFSSLATSKNESELVDILRSFSDPDIRSRFFAVIEHLKTPVQLQAINEKLLPVEKRLIDRALSRTLLSAQQQQLEVKKGVWKPLKLAQENLRAAFEKDPKGMMRAQFLAAYQQYGSEPIKVKNEIHLANEIARAYGRAPLQPFNQHPEKAQHQLHNLPMYSAGGGDTFAVESEVAELIRKVGGSRAKVTVTPMFVSDKSHGVLRLPVFKVAGTDGKDHFVIYTQHAGAYDSIEDFQHSRNGFSTEGVSMVCAKNGDLSYQNGDIELITGPARYETAVEKYGLDKVATVAVTIGALMLGHGEVALARLAGTELAAAAFAPMGGGTLLAEGLFFSGAIYSTVQARQSWNERDRHQEAFSADKAMDIANTSVGALTAVQSASRLVTAARTVNAIRGEQTTLRELQTEEDSLYRSLETGSVTVPNKTLIYQALIENESAAALAEANVAHYRMNGVAPDLATQAFNSVPANIVMASANQGAMMANGTNLALDWNRLDNQQRWHGLQQFAFNASAHGVSAGAARSTRSRVERSEMEAGRLAAAATAAASAHVTLVSTRTATGSGSRPMPVPDEPVPTGTPQARGAAQPAAKGTPQPQESGVRFHSFRPSNVNDSGQRTGRFSLKDPLPGRLARRAPVSTPAPVPVSTPAATPTTLPNIGTPTWLGNWGAKFKPLGDYVGGAKGAAVFATSLGAMAGVSFLGAWAVNSHAPEFFSAFLSGKMALASEFAHMNGGLLPKGFFHPYGYIARATVGAAKTILSKVVKNHTDGLLSGENTQAHHDWLSDHLVGNGKEWSLKNRAGWLGVPRAERPKISKALEIVRDGVENNLRFTPEFTEARQQLRNARGLVLHQNSKMGAALDLHAASTFGINVGNSFLNMGLFEGAALWSTNLFTPGTYGGGVRTVASRWGISKLGTKWTPGFNNTPLMKNGMGLAANTFWAVAAVPWAMASFPEFNKISFDAHQMWDATSRTFLEKGSHPEVGSFWKATFRTMFGVGAAGLAYDAAKYGYNPPERPFWKTPVLILAPGTNGGLGIELLNGTRDLIWGAQ